MAEDFIFTIDAVVFTIKNEALHLLLIKRKKEPYKGMYALPGGLVEKDEEVENAAARELEEETGVKDTTLKQFNVYSKVGRDPRGRSVSIAFYTLINSEETSLHAKDDAESAEWFPVQSLPELAFDHKEIINDVLQHLRHAAITTNITAQVLGKEFTIEQLKNTCEIILNKNLGEKNLNLVKEILKQTKDGLYTFDKECINLSEYLLRD